MSQRKKSGEVLYRVIHDPGVHIASSNKTKGRFRSNLLDDNTNRPDGFAELEPVANSENQHKGELSPLAQVGVHLLETLVATIAVPFLKEIVYPHINQLWLNNFKPTIKKKWNNLTDKRKDKLSPKARNKSEAHTNEIVTVNETEREMFTHELEESYEKYMYDMTSEEAQRELLDIFIHSALLIKKIRKLSNARILINEGASGEYLEGQKILEWLTTPEYIGSINHILENNPQLLDEKTEDLSSLLERNLVLNGQYVPIEIGMFKETMTWEVKVCDDKEA